MPDLASSTKTQNSYMHVTVGDLLDIKIVICSLLAGVERGLQLRIVKILNIPYETPSVGSRATQLIQLII
jgi:hypothetical protein